MIKQLHVNMHVIRRNHRDGRRDAPLSIKTSRANVKAHRVEIMGPSQLVYSPNQPLAGGRAWLETDAPVLVDSGERALSLP